MTKHYTDLELMQWRPAKNVGSATIGPRELCKVVTGGDGLDRSIVAVQQPDSTAGKSYCVNGPTPIAAGKFGRVCFGPVVLVQADDDYDTDDQVGWQDGSGEVSSGGTPIINTLRMVGDNQLLLGSMMVGTSLIPRILYDDVVPDDTDKNAWPVKDDMTADTSADKVLVQNVFPGLFFGYGSSHSGYSATTAAKVWTAIGTDGKEHIVAPSGQLIVKGTLSDSLSQGSSASASVKIQGVTVTITVYDLLMKLGATAIASGKKITAVYFPDEQKFYVVEAECP